uniref:D-aminoacyl-tRNA deacylase n=1 Tax=Cyanothece sp. (strain PCC 7425 / ATCC 29141) TaxID=395961 RepID=B8HTW1_CYAP4
MQLVDSHVHLNFDQFQPDLDAIAERWRQAGVVGLVHSCVEPAEFPAIQALAKRFRELYFAVGLHPLDADRGQSDLGDQLMALAQSDPKVVAIGETGLDFYKASNREQQEQVFWTQLEIAHRLGQPVIIHCRDAAAPMLDLLRRFWHTQGPVRGVMHCWGGTPEETEWFLDLGFYISFSGTVTFKNAKVIQASATLVPGDRLLVETDCPFLAPVPKRGERRNEPAYVRYVAEYLAQLRGVSPQELGLQTSRNACTLFNLPLLSSLEPIAPQPTPPQPVAFAS